MSRRRNNRRNLSLVGGLAALLCISIYALALGTSPPTRFDDSYMFLRYANNLIAGHGHAWDAGGEQVYGSTSLLHVGVVTVLKYSLSALTDARLLLLASALPGALMLAMLVATCGRFSTHRLLCRHYTLWAGLLMPTLALSGIVLYHHRTGMDTMLATLCNAALIFFTLRAARQGTVRYVVPVVIAGYLAFLARPDNGIHATLFPVLCFLLLGTGLRGKQIVVFVASMVGVLAFDAMAKWFVFGTPLPLAFYAKQHGAYAGYANPQGPNPLLLLQTFLGVVLPFLCVIGLLAGRRTKPILVVFFLPVALTFGYYFTVNQIMGVAGRFYMPSLPFFVVAAALMLDEQLCAVGRKGLFAPKDLLLRLTVLLLILAVGRQTLAHASAWYQKGLAEKAAAVVPRTYKTPAGRPLPPVDRWDAINAMARIAEEAPPGTTIALSEHGLIGAAAPHVVLIDLVGLHDRQFATEGFSAAELFRRKPDLIWMVHYHYTHIVGTIVDSESFWQDYTFYPGAFDYGLAIRNDSPHFDALSTLIDRAWKGMYGDLDRRRYAADYVLIKGKK